MQSLRRYIVGFLVLGAALSLAACGGGGESSSDEKYVRDICSAMAQFQEDVDDILSDPKLLADENKLVSALSDAFRKVTDGLAKARAPRDVRDYHESLVKEFRRVSDEIADGNLNALFANESPVEELPQEVQERLRLVARSVDECRGLSLFAE